MSVTSVMQAPTRGHQSVEFDGRCAGRKVSTRMRPHGRLSAEQRRSTAALAAPSLHGCYKCGAGGDALASECGVRRTLRRTQSQQEDAATGSSECKTATFCCSTCGAESSWVLQVWCRRRREGHQSVESDGRCAGRKVSTRMRPQGRLSAGQRRSDTAFAGVT